MSGSREAALLLCERDYDRCMRDAAISSGVAAGGIWLTGALAVTAATGGLALLAAGVGVALGGWFLGESMEEKQEDCEKDFEDCVDRIPPPEPTPTSPA